MSTEANQLSDNFCQHRSIKMNGKSFNSEAQDAAKDLILKLQQGIKQSLQQVG
ncbi:MAG TPA: hypothetical protein VIM85_11690 [Pseudomonadales bacterium]